MLLQCLYAQMSSGLEVCVKPTYAVIPAWSVPESNDMRVFGASTGEVTYDIKALVLCILERPNLVGSDSKL